MKQILRVAAVTVLGGTLLTACGSDTKPQALTTWNSTDVSTQQAWCQWGRENNLAGAGKALAALASNKFGYDVDYLDAMDVVAQQCGMA